MVSVSTRRLTTTYTIYNSPQHPNDWGDIAVFSDGETESYQVRRKGKDIGQPHPTYKAARAAMKALPEK